MIRHYCDGCGRQVSEENGVIRMKEVTMEFKDKKVSIAIEVDSMRRDDKVSDPNPAVCASCVAKKMIQWADLTIKDSHSSAG